MKFASPLSRGRLIKRYKRFLADIVLDSGEEITASCPNTGAMLGLSSPGTWVWVSHNDSPTRKYRHTLELVEHPYDGGTTLVGINTGLPNRLVNEAIAAGTIPALSGYATRRNEVKYGLNSRIDILLEDPNKAACYVEIKNVHLMRTNGLAEFPDSVTERGAKHLDELASMVEQGNRAVMVYLVQRSDAQHFSIAGDIDPAYARGFETARAAGVEAIVCRCNVSATEIVVEKLIQML
ncbi:MAG: DNA/RNA nuclease SfsA [Hyphomicrobiaceae bacterium]